MCACVCFFVFLIYVFVIPCTSCEQLFAGMVFLGNMDHHGYNIVSITYSHIH